MRPNRRAVPFAVALALLGVSVAFGTVFEEGDIFLLSRALPDVQPYEGIVEVNPDSGSVTELYRAETTVSPTLTYDAFRDLLIFSAVDSGLVGVNADGDLTMLVPQAQLQGPPLVAARGDGIIYLWFGSPTEFAYVDSMNTLHDLLDVPGTAPFGFPTGAIIQDMIYDPVSNALIVLTGVGIFPECPTNGPTCAAKIPLNAAGTQVSGPVTSVWTDVVPGLPEQVVGVAQFKYPGEFLVFLNKQTVPGFDLIQHFDVASMSFTKFATPSYAGDNVIVGGTYSTLLDKAVVNDTFLNVIRSYAIADSGVGDTLALGNSGGGHSEPARMVQIPVSAPVGVADAREPLPGLRLFTPYPNPFNPNTTIRFVLDVASEIELTIYDVTGRRVRTLLDETRDAGEHRIHWDGRNRDGGDAATGVYFLRLRSASESTTQRMVLIR